MSPCNCIEPELGWIDADDGVMTCVRGHVLGDLKVINVGVKENDSEDN